MAIVRDIGKVYRLGPPATSFGLQDKQGSEQTTEAPPMTGGSRSASRQGGADRAGAPRPTNRALRGCLFAPCIGTGPHPSQREGGSERREPPPRDQKRCRKRSEAQRDGSPSRRSVDRSLSHTPRHKGRQDGTCGESSLCAALVCLDQRLTRSGVAALHPLTAATGSSSPHGVSGFSLPPGPISKTLHIRRRTLALRLFCDDPTMPPQPESEGALLRVSPNCRASKGSSNSKTRLSVP